MTFPFPTYTPETFQIDPNWVKPTFTGISYDNVSFDISATSWIYGSAKDLHFNSDGTSFFVAFGDRVGQFDMSTAWDISTASYVDMNNALSTVTGGSSVGITFKYDGTVLYVIEDFNASNVFVRSHTLGAAWDISTINTAVSTSVRLNALPGFNMNASALDCLAFSKYGDQMYMGSSADEIGYFTLSTEWDLSTMSFVRAGNTTDGTFDADLEDLFVSPNGDVLYGVSSNSDKVSGFTLSPRHNLPSTVAVDTSFTWTEPSSGSTNPRGLYIKNDGSKLYVVNSVYGNLKVYQYSLQAS